MGGILSLAVPDKRFVFDAERDCSTLSSIVDAYFRGDKRPTPGAVAEFYLLSIAREGDITWDPFSKRQSASPTRRFSSAEVDEAVRKAREGEHVDIHVWSFTPKSFVRIIQQLLELGVLRGFEIVEEPRSREYEFMIALKRTI